MRFEFDYEQSAVCFYDEQGVLISGYHFGDVLMQDPDLLVSNETLAALEDLIKQASIDFPAETELRFYEELCYFTAFKMTRYWVGGGGGTGGVIVEQNALRDLIRAFDSLSYHDREVLLEAYMHEADLRPRSHDQVWLCSKPPKFKEAAKGLLIGNLSKGRKSTHADQCRKKLFVIGYELFLSLGETPTIANGGLFGRFMTTLLNDPVFLKHLDRPPENIKKLIEEAKKTVRGKNK